MRLDKFLSETTDLTRSLAKKALHREEVTVDGEVVKNAATHVEATQDVRWLGERLELVGFRYLMMNKPLGVECTTRPGRYPTVLELIDLPKVERLHPVGRLDVDTTGLVLLTDDGKWSHRVTSPRAKCDKVYRATLAEPLQGDAAEHAVNAFAQGILLDGEEKPTQPATLDILGSTEVRVTITEGKYHQVRRMFAAIGNRVESLNRESIGPLILDKELEPGECRLLKQEEIDAF
ncbi:pseudouridine synthase [Halomonas sp. McH1-25]|uniref:pseudouridine synthase n=1 Tax=unclassified Halomonas TaxID=2609666 RepID=UPI001EF5AF56|nr:MULTISPECIES: pseudouridine synthase [unclassified Halomonas]MCG7598329.1 pseudouridine synthase [Halomonas sp. McH1-25]MCP1340888.1 pseudouridine synthase [Halomonas sp. FL8]MCP1361611.1 pseudouridine synthase [Halomonas sp. BBD45]MCP1365004.1 pseudouridine synthase [Halomonas sp. BBD48]